MLIFYIYVEKVSSVVVVADVSCLDEWGRRTCQCRLHLVKAVRVVQDPCCVVVLFADHRAPVADPLYGSAVEVELCYLGVVEVDPFAVVS